MATQLTLFVVFLISLLSCEEDSSRTLLGANEKWEHVTAGVSD